ncbi:unnamed protein product [marine sediment metagenome]|uniref:HEPN domain-containing protein n=2 Tax=marine sediment metagenome TaxID=412755 RepID=X1AV29_9ZZZZ
MDYKDTVKIMLNQSLIKKQKVDFSHIEALLLRAQKDIVAAEANLKIDEEVTYDPFLPVSKIEAENALKTAEEFVKIVLKLVQKENPQLRFNFNK